MGKCKCIKKVRWGIFTLVDPNKLWLVSRLRDVVSKKGKIFNYSRVSLFYEIQIKKGQTILLGEDEFNDHYEKIT
jgi:hypothetical protein